MKKLSLFLAFSFIFLFFVSAQENNQQNKEEKEYSNKKFFLGLGAKGNVFVNDNARDDFEVWKKPSFSGNLFLGKWFSDKWGARISLEGGKLTPYFQERTWKEKESYFLGRVDLLFNLTNCFREYEPDQFYNLSPYVGIGGAHAFNAVKRPDNAKKSSSFVFAGGLLNTFRVADNFSIYLNLGLDVVDAKLDGYKGKKKFNGIAAGTIGLIYTFGDDSKN